MTATAYRAPGPTACRTRLLILHVPRVLPLGCRQVHAESQDKSGNRQAHAHIWEPEAAVCAGDLGTSITSLAPREAERILLLALILYGETLLSTALINK